MSFNRVVKASLVFDVETGNVAHFADTIKTAEKLLTGKQRNRLRKVLEGIPRTLVTSQVRKTLKGKLANVWNNSQPPSVPKRFPQLIPDLFLKALSFLHPREIGKLARVDSFFHANTRPALHQQFLSKTDFTGQELHIYRRAFHLQSIADLFLMDIEKSAERTISLTFFQFTGQNDFRETVLACPRLAEVKLVNCQNITDADIQFLAEKQPSIKSITVNSCPKLRDASLFFSGFRFLERIVFVKEGGAQHFDPAHTLKIPQFCPHLSAIHLIGTDFIPAEILHELCQQCPSLTEIYTALYPINPELMFKHVPNLKTVLFKYHGCLIGDILRWYRELKVFFPHIRIHNECFDIDESQADEEVLDLIKCFPQIKKLYLASGNIRAELLLKIVQNCPDLESILVPEGTQFALTFSQAVILAKYCPRFVQCKLASQLRVELKQPAISPLARRYQELLQKVEDETQILSWLNFRYKIAYIWDRLPLIQSHQIYNRFCPDKKITSYLEIKLTEISLKVLSNMTHLCNYLQESDMSADPFSISLEGLEDITDDTLISLANWHPDLKTIDISGQKTITDKAIVNVAKHAAGLEWISIDDCEKLTENSVVALAQNCPKLAYIDATLWSSCHFSAATALAKSHCDISYIEQQDPEFARSIKTQRKEVETIPQTPLGKYYISLLESLNENAIDGLLTAFLDLDSSLLSSEQQFLYAENFTAFCEEVWPIIESRKWTHPLLKTIPDLRIR